MAAEAQLPSPQQAECSPNPLMTPDLSPPIPAALPAEGSDLNQPDDLDLSNKWARSTQAAKRQERVGLVHAKAKQPSESRGRLGPIT